MSARETKKTAGMAKRSLAARGAVSRPVSQVAVERAVGKRTAVTTAAWGVTQWQTLSSEAPSRAGGRSGAVAAPKVDEVQRTGQQLQETFAEILRRLPLGNGKVAPLARWLDLDRSICQRVVLGVREAQDGLGVLERFPGLQGLEQFVGAAEQRGCAAAIVRDARRAVGQYAELVNAAGGSQARLVGHIESLRSSSRRRSSTQVADTEKARRKCYEGATDLTGLASQARVELVVIGPAGPGSAASGRVSTVSATGFIGLEAAAYAMPLTRRSRLAGLKPVPGAEGAPSGVTPRLLLPEFTTQPMPNVTTRTDGEQIIQIIDTETAQVAPVDVVAALTFSWTWGEPRAADSDFYSVGRIIGVPTRRLVFDVYLHHSLPAMRSVGAHVLRPGTHGSLGNARPESRWFDRIPGDHDLALLGGAPGDRPSEGYARLGELSRYLVEAMGWAGERFVGYRFEVAYPVFDFEYVIAAEY